MTIIVGIICKDGVVVASDSQAGSFRGVHVKRLDYSKIYDFAFDGNKVVLTGAGEAPFIIRAKEIIEQKGKEGKFKGSRDIADLAEQATTEIMKRYMVERWKELTGTKMPSGPAALQSDEAPNFALVLGTFCGDEGPCLFTVYSEGVAGREEGYASLGSGSAFAEYLLARLYRDDLTIDEGVRVAVYVVEEVKKVDLHCGGPTQAVVIGRKGINRKTTKEIADTVRYLEDQDNAIKEVWKVVAKGPQENPKDVRQQAKVSSKKS